MRKIKIDLINIDSIEAVHEQFKEKLELPEHYGMNLDALSDCLGDIHENISLVIYERAYNTDAEYDAFLDRLNRLLKISEEESDHLHIRIRKLKV